MNILANRFHMRLPVPALLIVSAASSIGCGDRETILMIEKPTEIHSITQTPASPESSSMSLQPGHVIATLKAGEAARAVGVYHGKDYDAFQAKLADGTEGLIIAADTFKVGVNWGRVLSCALRCLMPQS